MNVNVFIKIKKLEDIANEFDKSLSKFRKEISECKIANSPNPELCDKIYWMIEQGRTFHINYISRTLKRNKKELAPLLDYMEASRLIKGKEDDMTEGGGKAYSR